MTGKRAARRWLREHARDPYVREARQRGYRSRAAFKLLQLDSEERLLRPGRWVVDLGAAPGGWSQVAATGVAPGGRVFAVDRLDIEPLAGVDIVRGDFMDDELREAIAARLLPRGADLVLSDMAPNLTGVGATDEARAEALVVEVIEAAREWLKPSGRLVVKVFSSAARGMALRVARERFDDVRLRKPAASRSRSSELYLLATQRDGRLG